MVSSNHKVFGNFYKRVNVQAAGSKRQTISQMRGRNAKPISAIWKMQTGLI